MPGTSLIHIPCWYAVRTHSNQEKLASVALLNRGLECFLPTYETLRQRKDRRLLLTRPLFPGYLFVRIPAADKLNVMVVPGVADVLCSRPVWDAVDECQVECLRQKLAARRTEPHQYLPIGRTVTIVSGPFAGLEGVLVQHRCAKNKVVISLPAIVSAFSIEVEPSEVRENVSIEKYHLAQAAIC